MHYTLEY